MAPNATWIARSVASLSGLAFLLLVSACGGGSAGPSATSNVASVQSNSATLSWAPVTENTDGTQVQDLAGYKVYYGNVPYQFTNEVTLANPALTSYVVDDLASGTWYFAITAYASDGTESQYSNVASKVID
jgi:hypothetical protein